MIKKIFFLGLLFVAPCQLKAVVAIGTDADATTTFPFSIGSVIYNSITSSVWTATDQNLSAQDSDVQKYGLSFTPFISVDGLSSTPSTLRAYPSLTTMATVSQYTTALTLTPEVSNPLLGKIFTNLTLVGSNPTIVVNDEPNLIYYIQETSFSDNAQGLVSAQGTSIINKLEYAEDQQIHFIAGIGSSNLFSAHASGIFGSEGSKLSFIQLLTARSTDVFDTISYSCLLEQANADVAKNTPVLTANTIDLLVINPSIAMNPAGSFMYIGVDVDSAFAAEGRAVGLFVATGVNSQGVTPGSLTFSSIIPDAIVQSALSTPVSTVNNSRIAVRNISTTTTSTQLGYIFVARDNGIDQQFIYAMPMVTMPSTSLDFGKIAAFDSVETEFKLVGTTYRTQGFSQVIVDANEIDIAGSETVTKRIMVGAGAVPLVAGQYIEQLVAQGDSVYITISQQFATGTTPGMFKSDAIFDETGRVMAWTTWQIVGGTDDQMLFAIKNRSNDATMYVSPSTSGGIFNNVQQTTWNSSGIFQTFIQKINSYLPKNKGGVQGIFSFPTYTLGFKSIPTAEVSLVVATGNGNVLIAQTGMLDIDTQTLRILPQTTDTSIVIDESLGLDIGSVVTTDFGFDAAGQNWLFMGGSDGLAVLSKADGNGFETLPNIGAASALTNADQTCKTLGNFKFVKKIVADANYLYVMTQNAVYRILLLSNKFTATNPAALNPELIVTATQLAPFAYCLDMIVDMGVILLGTTSGLYSINTQGGLPGIRTSIPIPLGLPAISKIQAISYDYHEGFTIDHGFYSLSNLYVLSIDFATEQARLNRFEVVNGVVTPIEDQLFENKNGPLIVFDYMSNNMFIDGSLGFMTSYRIGAQPPVLKYLQYTLQAGVSGRHWNLANNTTDISIFSLKNSLGITGFYREYVSGALMMAADFGLLTDS